MPGLPFVSDQYRDVTWVASGGYGDIYRAVRTTTGASVAIKVMRDLGDSAALRRRTERELQALVRLRGHPNVVQIEEVIPFTGGFGLVMEYLEGGSLHDRVADGAPIPFPEVVRVGIDVSRALRDAHAMGIVHRDIKPQNLLISAFGQCKVCDFGIAAIVRDAALTDRTGAVSYRYASPEELADSPTIGPPTDVYSFGVSLRHMLTGSVDRESADRWFSAHHAKGPDNSNPIDALQRLIREAVEPVSVDRPTAADLLNEFLRIERSLGEGRAETIASAPNVRPAPVSPQSLPAPVSLFAAPVPVASTNVLPPPVPAANLETAASEVRVPVPSTVDRVVIDLPRARGQRTLFIRLATTAIVIGSVGALLFLIGKSERLVPANTGTSALSTTAPPQPTDSTDNVALSTTITTAGTAPPAEPSQANGTTPSTVQSPSTGTPTSGSARPPLTPAPTTVTVAPIPGTPRPPTTAQQTTTSASPPWSPSCQISTLATGAGLYSKVVTYTAASPAPPASVSVAYEWRFSDPGRSTFTSNAQSGTVSAWQIGPSRSVTATLTIKTSLGTSCTTYRSVTIAEPTRVLPNQSAPESGPRLHSPNGMFQLGVNWQTCALELYQLATPYGTPTRALWTSKQFPQFGSNSPRSDDSGCTWGFWSDGNLYLRKVSQSPDIIWSANFAPKPGGGTVGVAGAGGFLKLQDDGNLVEDSGGRAVWWSGTGDPGGPRVCSNTWGMC